MNPPPSVLLCISSLHQGGAQKIFSMLCTRAGGYKPIVLSFFYGGCVQLLRDSGVPTLVFFRAPWKADSALRQWHYLLRLRREPVSATAGFLPLGGVLAAAASIFLRVPFLYAIRCSLSYFAFRRGPLRALLHRLCLSAADNVICNSRSAALGLNRNSTDVIANAVEEPAAERKNDSEILRTFFSRERAFYVSIVCTMRYPPKDVFSALNAARELPGTEFVFVGGGRSLPAFRTHAAKLSLENVVFAGHRTNIYPFLQYADANLLLTEDEGFPNTILETMICRKPIIASRIPELEEILEDGRTALLVANRDITAIRNAILRLESDRELRELLARNAFETAKKRYAVESMVRAYADLFKTAGQR